MNAYKADSVSASRWWGQAFKIPLNASRKAGGEGLPPANGNVLSGLETSSATDAPLLLLILSVLSYKACLLTVLINTLTVINI